MYGNVVQFDHGSGKEYIEYVVQCRWGEGDPAALSPWMVAHRFSAWEKLNKDLRTAKPELVSSPAGFPPFPKKKLFGNTDPLFVETRQSELATFISGLLESHPVMLETECFQEPRICIH